MAKSMVEQFLSWIHPETQEAHLEPRAFHALCKRDPEAAKRLLRKEHKTLVDELDRLMAAVEQRVGVFAERLKQSRLDTLEQDYLLLLREREELLKLIERISLSELPSAALQEEWADWQRYFAEVAEPEERASQRAQLVRAELMLRGVRLNEARKAPMPDRMPLRPMAQKPFVEPKAFIPAEYDQPLATDAEGLAVLDDEALDWQPLTQAVEETVRFWNSQFVMLCEHPNAYSPLEAAEIVRHYRDNHQKLAQHDRMQGLRRFRVHPVLKLT